MDCATGSRPHWALSVDTRCDTETVLSVLCQVSAVHPRRVLHRWCSLLEVDQQEVVDDGRIRSANWLNWAKDTGVTSCGLQCAGMPADLLGVIRLLPDRNNAGPWALPFDLLRRAVMFA